MNGTIAGAMTLTTSADGIPTASRIPLTWVTAPPDSSTAESGARSRLPPPGKFARPPRPPRRSQTRRPSHWETISRA